MMKNKINLSNKNLIISLSIFLLIASFTLATIILPGSTSVAFASTEVSQVPGSFAELVKKVSPSVVNISAVKVIKGRGRTPTMPFGQNDPFGDFFDRYFRDQMPREYRQSSLGTGFIIDKDGYIFTNNHVIEMAEEVKVTLADKREFDAEIVGHDPKTDIALIKIKDAKDIVPLALGDSDKIEVGDWVVAIGNPFNLGHTVTAGIVSAKYRNIGAGPYDNFIQTDASINPGNSGGPLLNTNGEVIGINTLITSPSGGSIGIGFAIPINMAKDILAQLKEGKVVRGWLGVMIQEITPDIKDKLDLKSEKGALVADVTTGGPAEKAGFKRGDVIVSFDGKDIKESSDLPYIVSSSPVGKKVDVDVIRKGKRMTIEVKLGELQEEGEGPVMSSRTAPKIGLTVEKLTPELARNYGLSESTGLIITQVDNNSPAAEAGLRQGDIILEIDQEQVTNLAQFNQKLSEYKAGDTILFLVKRQGAAMYLTLKVWE
jgi:serine protease Do